MIIRMSAALLGVALIVAGCGGVSAEEYFQEVEQGATAYDLHTGRFFGEYSSAVNAALAQFQAATADVEPEERAEEAAKLLAITVTEITKAFEEAAVAVGAFLAILNGLDPPGDVEAEHAEAVTTLTRSRDAIPDLVVSLRGAENLQDVGALINASTFGDTQPRVAEACRGLQGAATDLGLTVDLHCSDPLEGE